MSHYVTTTRSLLCALAAILSVAAFAADSGSVLPVESEYGTNRAPVQVFYVPLPEEHVHDALRSILDADGNVTTVTDGMAVPADPSGTLSVRIPTTENDASGFFSLRVNILDDASNIR